MPVYLVDSVAYKPPEELKVRVEDVEKSGRHWQLYSPEVERFMRKVFEKSGMSDNGTYLPTNLHPSHTSEPKGDMETAHKEAEMVMCTAAEQLFQKTGLQPKDIDIVVTCCSIFCPTPSLSSMLVNRFNMRPDVQTYSLHGMGCGAGVLGIRLMEDLLKAQPNCNAMFVPAEIVSYCGYPGRYPNWFLANIIFRMGGAAILLSNKPSMRFRAKYELQLTHRVTTASDDGAYGCMKWGPDPDGINGVYLSKDVVKHASNTLTLALTQVAPRIMSLSQLASAGWNRFQKSVLGRKQLEDYMPDFTQCAEHFCIHAGGYQVLKGVQKGMRLPAQHMLPSFAALRDYGNTSASTTYYVLSYLESVGLIKYGDRIMQIGMGGGMKVGVCMWRALRDVWDAHPAWVHLQGQALVESDLPREVDERQDKQEMREIAKNMEALSAKLQSNTAEGSATRLLKLGTDKANADDFGKRDVGLMDQAVQVLGQDDNSGRERILESLAAAATVAAP